MYPPGDKAKCVNSALNERTITCDPGYYAIPPLNPTIILKGGEFFAGCTGIYYFSQFSGKKKARKTLFISEFFELIFFFSDINECLFGCVDKVNNVPAACAESSAVDSVPANQRTCTCPDGFIVYGQTTAVQKVTLEASAQFSGCVGTSFFKKKEKNRNPGGGSKPRKKKVFRSLGSDVIFRLQSLSFQHVP